MPNVAAPKMSTETNSHWVLTHAIFLGNEMTDPTMEQCLQAGWALANPILFPMVPFGSLADQAAREKFVLDTEYQIDGDIKAEQFKVHPGIIARVLGDHSLTK
jgi:hypothetical protein